eukprot:3175757-Alexandrium_andersonii.AAC.1
MLLGGQRGTCARTGACSRDRVALRGRVCAASRGGPQPPQDLQPEGLPDGQPSCHCRPEVPTVGRLPDGLGSLGPGPGIWASRGPALLHVARVEGFRGRWSTRYFRGEQLTRWARGGSPVLPRTRADRRQARD